MCVRESASDDDEGSPDWTGQDCAPREVFGPHQTLGMVWRGKMMGGSTNMRVKCALLCCSLLACLGFLFVPKEVQLPEDALLVPGVIPLDDRGRQVQAHAGWIINHEGKYLWYGESRKFEPDWLSLGVNLYSSTNLVDWHYEGMVFDTSQIKNFPLLGPYRIERPKVLYNEQYRYYVLLFHMDVNPFQWPSVGVATSESPYGPFAYRHFFQPFGKSSFDMSVFKRVDGTAYLVNSVENEYTAVSKLTDDYLNTTEKCGEAPQGEAQSIFTHGGEYYLMMSWLSGWAPNRVSVYVSPTRDLCTYDWRQLEYPAVGSLAEKTFNSQPGFVYPFQFQDGEELLLYWGDRWNEGGMGGVANASYVILPLIPNPNGLGFKMQYYLQWKLSDFHPINGPHAALARQRFYRGWGSSSRS